MFYGEKKGNRSVLSIKTLLKTPQKTRERLTDGRIHLSSSSSFHFTFSQKRLRQNIVCQQRYTTQLQYHLTRQCRTFLKEATRSSRKKQVEFCVSTKRLRCNETVNLQTVLRWRLKRTTTATQTDETNDTPQHCVLTSSLPISRSTAKILPSERTWHDDHETHSTPIWSPLHTLAHAHTLLNEHVHRITASHSLRQLEKGFCS